MAKTQTLATATQAATDCKCLGMDNRAQERAITHEMFPNKYRSNNTGPEMLMRVLFIIGVVVARAEDGRAV